MEKIGFDRHALTDKVKMKALELGFTHVGVTTCDDFADYADEVRSRDDYSKWSNSPTSFVAGCFPKKIWPQGKSIICASVGVGHVAFPEKMLKHVGRIYLARCYSPQEGTLHALRAQAYTKFLESLGMKVFEHNEMLPARIASARAGVVTYGKNNFARTEDDGTFIILYPFMVDVELDYDEPTVEDHCPPDCTLCIDACPTHAIEGPRRLHPDRCVLRNNMKADTNFEVAALMGERIHGCDVCQEVCPRNHEVLKRATVRDPFIDALADRFDLERILFLDDDYYEGVVRPIMYNYIRDFDIFRRNAAVAMGNSGNADYVAALERAIETYPGTIVSEAAAWAIERLRGSNE